MRRIIKFLYSILVHIFPVTATALTLDWTGTRSTSSYAFLYHLRHKLLEQAGLVISSLKSAVYLFPWIGFGTFML